MLLRAKIAPFVVLATRVVAGLASVDDTLVLIPITKRITPAGTVNVVQKDYKRSRFLLNGSQQHEFWDPNVPLNDVQAVGVYTAEIGVGDPPTFCKSCQVRALSASRGLLDTRFRPTRY
jgi:hypothetical protein